MFNKPFKPKYYPKNVDEVTEPTTQTRSRTNYKHVKNMGIKPVPKREHQLPEAVPVRISRPRNTPKQVLPITPEVPQEPIHIFFHIWITGDWKIVAEKMWNRLIDSGLVDIATSINISVLKGSIQNVEYIFRDYNVNYVHVTSNEKEYERGVLRAIKAHSQKNVGNVLYVNTFAVNKSKFVGVKDWQEMVIYFLIYNHKYCVKKLLDHDALGVNLEKLREFTKTSVTDPEQAYTFSGNMWWARSSYLSKLPNVGSRFLDPQIWISTCKTKDLHSIWDSHIDHYQQRYPKEKYHDSLL